MDPTHTVNVFASWERGEIALVSGRGSEVIQALNLQLQHEARETLAMLTDPEIDRFADVFLKPLVLPSARFDEHVRYVQKR